jgi:hypothetical protein
MLFLISFPLAFQLGVDTARAQLGERIEKILDCGLIGSVGYDHCMEQKKQQEEQENSGKECDDALADLEAHKGKFATAHSAWKDVKETWECERFIGEPSHTVTRNQVREHEQTADAERKAIEDALQKAREVCPTGRQPSNPLAKSDSKECADKEIAHACQAKKQSQLEAAVSKHCKPKDQSTSEDYQKCRDATKELEQRKQKKPIQQARDEADRACGRS